MGQHLAHSRSIRKDVKPQAIRYTLAKRLAIHGDYQAGLPWNQIAERHNVSLSTVHAAVNDPNLSEIQDQTIVNHRRNNVACFFEYIADKALSNITDEKLEKMNSYQLMMIAATAVDKARLLQGLSTENLSVKGLFQTVQGELEDIKKRRIDQFRLDQRSKFIEKSKVVDTEQDGVLTSAPAQSTTEHNAKITHQNSEVVGGQRVST